jgi:hypothetical protein
MTPRNLFSSLFAALLVAGALSASLASASSHREAPAISKDPTADNTDVYAFRSPDKPNTVTMISNWLPLLEPAGGPNFYAWDDKAVYTIIVDNVGDAQDHIVYEFYFKTHVRNGNTFLYNTGAVTSPGDADLNIYQTYSVKKTVNGSSSWIGQDLLMQPNRVGPKSTPNIADIAEDAVHKLSDGSYVFAGERDDPFFVDLGGIFDLLTIRKLPGDLGQGVDGLRGFNTMSIAIQVPIEKLTKDSKSAADTKYPILGIYSTTERDGKRVSRLGAPLVNEVVIPLKDKDKWNTSDPADDGQFLSYVTNPELAGLLNALYGISVPPAPRNDLVAVFLTGVAGLTQPAGGTPNEMLRLNVSIAPSTNPSRLGVLAGDLAGFPNGRRLADDVTDIELRAVAGVLVTGFNIAPNNRLGDGVDFNDRTFLKEFPYVARPFDPVAHSHHRTEPASGPGPAAEHLAAGQAGGESTIIVESEDSIEGADEDSPLQIQSQQPAKRALLRYTLARDAAVTLRIFDVQGRTVKTLVDERNQAGAIDVQWDGSDEFGSFAGNGVFFARYSVDGKLVNTKKLVIR